MDKYMYWLATLYMLGSRKQKVLLKHFGSGQALWNASPEELMSVPGLTANNIRIIQKNKNLSIVNQGLETLKRMAISFVWLGHPDYPSLLSKIPGAPIGLFYLGRLPKDDMPKVAIIGSRRCSPYGLSTARSFGLALAKHGVVIVSGMARGIDSMAHTGALEADGGCTIAVLGCGVDICYPAENHSLRDNIAKNGCVISEYPPGVRPLASYFPARNRIISGLSQIVVVVEAGKKSGTLITVDQALDQGRDVMAVPGNIINKYSQGTNSLIKQGAEVACNYEDILHMLGIEFNEIEFNKTNGKNIIEERPNIATDEKLVYDVLASQPFTPLTIDEIIVKSKSQPRDIQHQLTMLELKGYIKRMPGMKFVIEN